MSKRSYSGPAIDGTYQHISDRPELDEQAETVEYATDPEPEGEETVENLPDLSEEREIPDVDGQTSWDDWGWSK